MLCGPPSDSSSEGSGEGSGSSSGDDHRRASSSGLSSALHPPRAAAGVASVAASSEGVPARRSLTDIAGATRAGGWERPVPTREELIEQGVDPSEVDARLVRMHQDEILMQTFGCWILCFTLLVSLGAPVIVMALLWMLIQGMFNNKVDCDPPLRLWIVVVCVTVLSFGVFFRGRSTGAFLERLLCHWTPDGPNARPPLRVQLLHLAVSIFLFGWNCLGVYWTNAPHATKAGQQTTTSGPNDLPLCYEVAGSLNSAVRFYASLHIAYALFMCFNMVGFAHILQVLLNRGIWRTNNAAPSGALEKNTEVVQADDAAVLASPSCSVCLESFLHGDRSVPIVRTLRCSHVFHRPCLEDWLKVNRTCPLCREDLGSLTPHETELTSEP